jgi:acetyl esterase/lipase
MVHVTAQTGPDIFRTPDYRAIEPDVGEYGVWVEAVPDLINDELRSFAAATSVEPIRIPGYWVHEDGSDVKVASSPAPGEKVLYHLHGGGYTRLSAHPSSPIAAVPRGLLKLADPIHRTFSIEYRLSSTEPWPVANPFPAALLDALAGYNYLVNVVGYSPSDIIICGESAGGNLTHALTRYLVENNKSESVKVPGPPGSIILLSPWCDLSTSHDTPGSSFRVYQGVDIIRPDSYDTRAYLGPHGSEAGETNRYISPSCKSLAVDFKGFPRTFINAGGVELLLDEIKTLKSRMCRDLGEGDGLTAEDGKVKYVEEANSVHAYVVFAWQEPERSRTMKEITDWITAAA